MINKYEIKNINNKEVLYVYIDINNEFAKKEFSKNKKKIDKYIKDFVKKNKIGFTGGMAVLVINGLFAGNVFLNRDNKSNINNNSVLISEIVKNEDLKNILKLKNDVVTTETKVTESENKVEETIVNESEVDTVKKSVSKSNSESEGVNSQSDYSTVENKGEVVDNNTYVTVRRTSGEILRIELEEYIYGVVAAEMPAEFNSEALKSQAIISRTYTFKALSKNQTLTDNESTQSYKSDSELKSLWGSKYDQYSSKIRNVVNSTKGLYLSYNGAYIEAVFHSTSNGKTEDAKNVWGNSFPYLVSVDSSYDTTNKSFYFEKEIAYSELSSKFNTEINKASNIYITEKTEGDRVKTLTVNDRTFTGVQVRSLLGLRSADFEVVKTDNGIVFKTKGYGHGVGLSQYGANGMANAGYSYEQILSHYYPNTTLSYK